MATLGKTATPNSSTHGWILGGGYSVGMLFTVPAGGGIFTSVTFWVAGDGGNNVNIQGVIWDGSGNVLGSGGSVGTSGGQRSSPGGSGQWYTSYFGSNVFIGGGTSVYIGWEPNSSGSCDWAFNGGDNSPNAEWASGHFGGPSSFSGHTTESPSGAVAAFATYTPVSAPSISGFSPSVGPAGTTVTITGSQFTLASSVNFNGTGASFTINSDSQITATVPAGATTGPIHVVNPDGTATSGSNFVVGSVYGDSGAAFQSGCLVYGDSGTAWQAGGQAWVDSGSGWTRVL